jgi:O-antigen/teichoic acid export membrane protein
MLSVVVSATAAATTLAIARRKFHGARAVSHLSPVAALRQSLPVLVSNLTAFVILNVDVWVVGSALPERTVATYAAAARMVTLISLAAAIANQVLPPLIGELHARGERGLMERLLRGTAFVVGVPALLAAAVFVFAGPLVLRIAFGPAYEAGATVLAILAVGQVAAVLTGSTAYTLIMTGRQVASMWLAAGAAVTASIACFAVVGRFGTTGVAAALASVFVVQQLVSLVVARRLVGVWTHASPTAAIAELRKFLARRA